MVDINLIPKEYREKRKGLKNVFSKTTIIVLVFVILSLFFYGGLFLYKRNLNKSLEALNQEILILDQKRDLKTEQAMIDLDRRINVLKKIFENHFYWSDLLGKIEDLTIPEVYFNGAKIAISQDGVTFNSTGTTLTYTSLARQILILQEDKLIKDVKVSAISLTDNMGIKFDVLVDFSKDILLGKHD